MSSYGIQKLTERQKEILRLILIGFDAKSAARQLGISVHTVNEHLREARRHLGVSSSRQAARLLGEAESGPPNSMGSNTLGVVRPTSRRSWFGRPIPNGRMAYAGVSLVILAGVAAIAFATGNGGIAAESRDTPPKVIATQPSAGAMIAPGPFTLGVTFDRPMLDGNYSFVQVSPETYPNCELHPQMSPNARSFTLRCRAELGHSYEVWFNRPPYMNFKSSSGVSADPYQLRFSANSR